MEILSLKLMCPKCGAEISITPLGEAGRPDDWARNVLGMSDCPNCEPFLVCLGEGMKKVLSGHVLDFVKEEARRARKDGVLPHLSENEIRALLEAVL